MKIGNRIGAFGIVLGAMLGLWSNAASAQQTGSGDLGNDLLNSMGRGTSTQQVTPAVATRSVALESVINPNEYIVGPSDGFRDHHLDQPPDRRQHIRDARRDD